MLRNKPSQVSDSGGSTKTKAAGRFGPGRGCRPAGRTQARLTDRAGSRGGRAGRGRAAGRAAARPAEPSPRLITCIALPAEEPTGPGPVRSSEALTGRGDCQREDGLLRAARARALGRRD